MGMEVTYRILSNVRKFRLIREGCILLLRYGVAQTRDLDILCFAEAMLEKVGFCPARERAA